MLQSRKRSFVSFLNSIISAGAVSAVAMTVTWLALAAAPANAALITLCEGDCSVLGTIENPGSDTSFDVGLGLKVVTDGLDLRLKTDGNIFVRGPLRGDTISLNTGGALYIDSTAGQPGSTEIPGKIGVILGEGIDLTGLILSGGSIIDVSTGSAHFEIVNPGQGLQIVAAPITTSTGGDPPAQILSLVLTGDVFLDLSMVSFSNLELTAGDTIVIDFSYTTNVPEPSTAMLLGLGLVAFSARRKRVAPLLPEGGRR